MARTLLIIPTWNRSTSYLADVVDTYRATEFRTVRLLIKVNCIIEGTFSIIVELPLLLATNLRNWWNVRPPIHKRNLLGFDFLRLDDDDDDEDGYSVPRGRLVLRFFIIQQTKHFIIAIRITTS